MKKTFSKAQTELWLLTKIGMLFFIISLSLIALNVSNTEKSALCGEQALATSRIIASNVNQVLSSPVEDARIVYKFEPTIAVSKERFGERYEVWLARRESIGRVQLSVVVVPASDKSCIRRASLFYDPLHVSTIFYSGAIQQIPRTDISPGEEVFKLTPSDRDISKRSKYLVIAKCKEKTFGGNTFVYFDDCKNDNADACSPFEPTAEHLQQCR